MIYQTSFSSAGTIVETTGHVRLPQNQVPLMFSGDEVQVQTVGGKLSQIQLAATSTKVEDVHNALKRHLLLRRYSAKEPASRGSLHSL